MKLVIFPISLISNFVIEIIKSTFPIHFILFPFTNVLPTLLVEESSIPMSQPVEFEPFILAFLISLTYKLHPWLLLNLYSWLQSLRSEFRLSVSIKSLFFNTTGLIFCVTLNGSSGLCGFIKVLLIYILFYLWLPSRLPLNFLLFKTSLFIKNVAEIFLWCGFSCKVLNLVKILIRFCTFHYSLTLKVLWKVFLFQFPRFYGRIFHWYLLSNIVRRYVVKTLSFRP